MLVSINGGTPKWLRNLVETPIGKDDLGVPLGVLVPHGTGNPHMIWYPIMMISQRDVTGIIGIIPVHGLVPAASQ